MKKVQKMHWAGYENTDLEKAPEAESELRAVEEAEQTDGESGKEASSEAMDADALQLSIEDEEKLLNEEEENFDKSKGSSLPDPFRSVLVLQWCLLSEFAVGKATSKTAKANKADAKKLVAPATSGRNVWVSNLSSTTRAADLKALFSKHGKVVAAKIVTNARTPGARCYGFITMGTMEEAIKCVQHLHGTELHGKTISVERTKYEPGGALKRSEAKNNQAKARANAAAARKATDASPAGSSTGPAKAKAPVKKTIVKKLVKPKAPAEKPKASTSTKDSANKDGGEKDDEVMVIDDNEDSKDKHREKRSSVRDRHSGRSRSRDRPAPRHSYTSIRRPYERSNMGFYRRPSFYQRPFFNRGMSMGPSFRGPSSFGPHRPPGGHDPMALRRMREERLRVRERIDLREEERRSYHDSLRQRELERKQREESYRLERERERLRVEREKLEREKLELICLEREKQRQERERIQKEREELRQRQLLVGRTEETRRPIKRPLVPDRREDDTFYAERRRSHPSRPEYEGSASSSSKPVSQRSDRDERFASSSSSGRHSHHSSHHHHSSHGSAHSSSHGSAHGSTHGSSSHMPSSSLGSQSFSSSRNTDYRHNGTRSSMPAPPPPPSSSSSSSRRPSMRDEWRSEGTSRREHSSSYDGASTGRSSGAFAVPSWSKAGGSSSSSFPSSGSGSQQWVSSSSSSSRKPESSSSWNGGSGDHHHHRWNSTVGSSTGSRGGGSTSSHSSVAVGSGGYSNSLSNGGVGSSFSTGDRYSSGSSMRRY
ncbi:hypothetical protein V5799_016948 [Amblyomma americanum]|uniref:RRM domain-containing protein n=1 Tax=Amblyomma americanum TaxID=6943 RepID=A0AAQ4F4H1_AMBAM